MTRGLGQTSQIVEADTPRPRTRRFFSPAKKNQESNARRFMDRNPISLDRSAAAPRGASEPHKPRSLTAAPGKVSRRRN